MASPRFLIQTILAILFFSACSTPQTPTPTETPLPPTVTASPTSTFTPTATSTQTLTPTPTDTPTPTFTPTRTDTPTPAATPFQISELPGRLAMVDFNCQGFGICTDISVARPDLSEHYQITNNEHALALSPRWAPNGLYLVYQLIVLGEDGGLEIWLYDFEKKQNINLTPNRVERISGISWSPDSRYLAFGNIGHSGEGTDIYQIDIQTKQITNLSRDFPGRDEYPTWSPDGSLIAFASDRGVEAETTLNIWIMDSNGTNPRNLTSNDGDGWHDTMPAWSPDSSYLAFYRYSAREDAASRSGPAGLWVTDVKDTIESFFYEFVSPEYSDPPVWSSDGLYIAFNHGVEDLVDIWLCHTGSRETIKINDEEGYFGEISWSPDGRAFIYSRTNSSQILLFILDPAGWYQLPGPDGLNGANWGP